MIFLTRIIDETEATEFEEIAKRQTLFDARFYLLAAELCIVRMKRSASCEKIDELIALIDRIRAEHVSLWERDNFGAGLERSVELLDRHRKELLEMR